MPARWQATRVESTSALRISRMPFLLTSQGVSHADAGGVLDRRGVRAPRQSRALMDGGPEILHDLKLKVGRQRIAEPVSELERHIGVRASRTDFRAAPSLAKIVVDRCPDG